MWKRNLLLINLNQGITNQIKENKPIFLGKTKMRHCAPKQVTNKPKAYILTRHYKPKWATFIKYTKYYCQILNIGLQGPKSVWWYMYRTLNTEVYKIWPSSHYYFWYKWQSVKNKKCCNFQNISPIGLIFDVYHYDKKVQIFAKYDVSMLSDMARKTAHTLWWWHTMTTTKTDDRQIVIP